MTIIYHQVIEPNFAPLKCCFRFLLQLVQVRRRRRRVGRGPHRPAASAMQTGCCWRGWTLVSSGPCTPAASSPCTNGGGEDWTRGRRSSAAASRRSSTTSSTDKYKWVHRNLVSFFCSLMYSWGKSITPGTQRWEGSLNYATCRTLWSCRLHKFYIICS